MLAVADGLARESLRVLAIARRTHCPADVTAEAAEAGQLEFLGLVGMHDPPRPEVADAVRRCRGAGIRVVMVTGDHGLTAEAIAQRIGLVSGPAAILDGATLEGLDEPALVAALAEPDVLVSRVTPEQKLRIAQALRAAGEVVAMTGDGVNDAPALRTADIGIAMGRSGTDVAREAADIILLDDNFASIAAAVEEGRAVYDNIRRFAQYHFSSNVAELLAFLTWGLSGGAIPLPIVVMQVLAVDLGTDLLPAIALGTERAEPGIMDRAPRPRSERLLNRRVLGRVYGFVGLLVGVAGLTSFLSAYWLAGWRPWEALADEGDLYVQATAATYAGIVMGQVGAGMAFRTSRESIFKVGLLTNRFLLVGIAFEIGLLFALLYVPALQRAFHMRPLDAPHVVVAGRLARHGARGRGGPQSDRPAPSAGGGDHMRVLIVGAQRLGRVLANNLLHGDHDVRLLEASEERLAQLPEALQGRALHGSPMDRETLAGRWRAATRWSRSRATTPSTPSWPSRRGASFACRSRSPSSAIRRARGAGRARRAHRLPDGAHRSRAAATLVRSGVESELLLDGEAGVYRADLPARLSGRTLGELERRASCLRSRSSARPRAHGRARPRAVEGDVLHVAAAHRSDVVDLVRP